MMLAATGDDDDGSNVAGKTCACYLTTQLLLYDRVVKLMIIYYDGIAENAFRTNRRRLDFLSRH